MFARISLIASLAATLILSACNGGDSPSNVVMTVEAGDFEPGTAYTVEYVLSCEGFDMEDLLEGLLEPAGPGSSQEIFAAGGTTLWVGRVEVPPGRCAAHFRQRDSEDEVICSGGEEFTVAANVSTEVDHVLTCELF